MAAVIEVKLELGHKAKVRDFLSPKGHTHDWVVFVKGANNIKLDYFVEKVVFWLHEDYEPSKRVIRREPHIVEESGFDGFIILIDVHFKNHEEPKMVRFQYDLFLHGEGMPPVNYTRLEKLTFTNPTEDFRKKLLKAGALLVSPPPSSRHFSAFHAVVEVTLELGHKAKVRDFPSPKGHTHDYVVFVKGANDIKLDYFVEKVVFWLHEDYEPSKRVFRREPYALNESGFAGFIIPIDVHFKSHEEPKMVRFQYDLFLQVEGMPPVNHTRLEKLTSTNPTEDFRKRLLKAGALLVSPPSSRHFSKRRSSRSSSPPSKKERSKSKDSLKHQGSSSSSSRRLSSPPSKRERSRSKDSVKHRDGSSSSSHRTYDEKKRSSFAESDVV